MHSTDNYTIGKGILYVATYTNGVVGTYEDVGNAPSIEVEPTIERLPHYSSRTGYRTKDKNPIIQTDYTLRFDLDEPGAANLTRFLMATRSGVNILGLQATDAEFAFKFVTDNPAGPNATWHFHRVTIKPAGPMALISEEWATMSFECEGLSDTVGNPTSPYITVTMSSAAGISASASVSPSASLSPSASSSS